ncbi:MAG: NmrA family transcriptional regulator [Pseudonocardia sp. SCN 72-86]|nr:MAG: NmrA family transcriptional regulator [Pseudonocardia sp. SCN 72-86]
MRIAVTTPTGNVGRHVVGALIRAGLRPTVLVRDPARLDPAVRGHVDAVATDLADPGSVAAATEGVDAVYWVHPSPTVDPAAEYARYTESLLHALRTNGIGRVVFQSSIGAERRKGAGEIDGLGAAEDALDATGVAVVHLRCGFFFTNLLLQIDAVRGGTVPVLLPVDAPIPWVAPRDIAEVGALRLLGPRWEGSRVEAVHGPADLTWTQATAIVSEATGHEVRAERIPDEAMREMLGSVGMSAAMVDGIVGMSTGLRDDFTPEQPRTAATTTPTTLGAWAFENLRPALGASGCGPRTRGRRSSS